MRRLSIEKGDAFILVYSVADSASWQEVIHLRQLILEEKLDQRANNSANTPNTASANTALITSSTGAAGSRSGSGSGSGEEVRVSCVASNKNKNRNNQSRPAHLARSALATPLGDVDNNKPISSIYDAATRLASSELRSSSMRTPSSGRRFSVNQPPSVGATPTRKGPLNTTAQAVSPGSKTVSTTETTTTIEATTTTTTTTASTVTTELVSVSATVTTSNTTKAPATSGEEASVSPVGRSTIAHFNSQLSKLLQQAPSSGSTSKGKLLQWQNIEQKDNIGNSGGYNTASTTITATTNYEQRSDQGSAASRRAHAIGRSSGSSSDKSSDLEGSSPNSSGLPFPDTGGGGGGQLAGAGVKSSRTPIVVVANKCDLDRSAYQVDQDEAERLVRDQWVSFGASEIWTSAR